LFYKKEAYVEVLGIGDWGLGIGDWGLAQSPIPILNNKDFISFLITYYIYIIY